MKTGRPVFIYIAGELLNPGGDGVGPVCGVFKVFTDNFANK
jgi:hypothetical protein